MNKEEITSVYRNSFGDIISFQTSSGRIISYRKALLEAMDEKITGVNIIETDDGSALFSDDDFQELPSYY